MSLVWVRSFVFILDSFALFAFVCSFIRRLARSFTRSFGWLGHFYIVHWFCVICSMFISLFALHRFFSCVCACEFALCAHTDWANCLTKADSLYCCLFYYIAITRVAATLLPLPPPPLLLLHYFIAFSLLRALLEKFIFIYHNFQQTQCISYFQYT